MTTYSEPTNNPHRMAPVKWLALTAVCIAAALAPRAFAASCTTTSLALTADRWTMVGIPCVPVSRTGGAAQVGNVFLGTNLTAANYFNGNNAATATWVLWQRTYTAAGDSYRRMAATDPVTTGGAYWLYTRVAGGYQVNGTPTPGAAFTVPSPGLPAAPAAGRYIMYANPWATTNPLNWSALLWNGTFLGFPFVNSTTSLVVAAGLVSKDVSYWNGNTYLTRDNTNAPVATFRPNEAAWIQIRPLGSGFTNVQITANKP